MFYYENNIPGDFLFKFCHDPAHAGQKHKRCTKKIVINLLTDIYKSKNKCKTLVIFEKILINDETITSCTKDIQVFVY